MMFKKGDMVRVKSWEQLVEEFGVTQSGNIKTKMTFVSAMKKYCDNIFEIYNVDRCERYYYLAENGKPISWWFDEKVLIKEDDVELDDLICVLDGGNL